jgi:hypothetical protein
MAVLKFKDKDGNWVSIPSIKGERGTTPQIIIGTVETLPAGSEATATITGTTEDPMLNLGIPKGASGSDAEVPDWAKQPEKPTYTLEELDAQPAGDYALKSEIPSVDGLASTEYIDNLIGDINSILATLSNGGVE